MNFAEIAASNLSLHIEVVDADTQLLSFTDDWPILTQKPDKNKIRKDPEDPANKLAYICL